MNKKAFIPISALMVALLLALVAAMTPFVAEDNSAYAQVNSNTDATLSNLALSGGVKLNEPLALTGDTITHSYTATVPHSTNRITVTATPNIRGAQVIITHGGTVTIGAGPTGAVTGATSASGGAVPLNAGAATTIGIQVRALGYADEDDTATTTVTETELYRVYEVTVTRLSAGLSNNADLSDLEISSTDTDTNATTAPALSPGFKKNVQRYTTRVSHVTNTLTVTPTRDFTSATFDVTSDKGAAAVDNTDTTAPVVTLDTGPNVITIKVTSESLERVKTYTLTATRAESSASDDDTLRSLNLTGITLSETFKASETAYTANVPHRITQTTVTFATTYSGALATVTSPRDANPLAAGHQVSLGVGRNDIVIMVTAENVYDTDEYTVAVTRAPSGAASNAKLAATTGLRLDTADDGVFTDTSAVTLSPGFDPDVENYTALVANGTSIVEVNATAANTGAMIDITAETGRTVGDDEETTDDHQTLQNVGGLKEGANVITIMVTAADLETTKTYTLEVTRAASNAANDARLSALMVNGESVSGVSSWIGSDTVADYTDGVANGVNSIAISATPNHSGAKVSIQTGGATLDATTGWTVDSDGMVGLSIGDNNIRIQVTAEDGATVSNYFLVITRASASDSGNAKLTNLTLSGITISPAFSPNTMMYSADVPVNIASTTVRATAMPDDAITTTAHEGARSVVITSDTDDDIGMDSDEDPHEAEHSITLSGGDNVITIVVTAADYESMETYEVRVVRGASNNAKLSSLSLTDSMDMGVTLYHVADVAAHWDTLDCPAMNDRVGADDQMDDMSSPYCRMYDGLRADAKAVVDATYMGFMSDVDMYYAKVANDIDMVTVSAMEADPDASVSGTGDVNLVVGDNTIEVMVTAEDGTTMMTYTVMVNRAGSSDASLSSLSLMGSDGMAIELMPMFASGTTAYTASVSSDVTTATASATATDSGAMVSGTDPVTLAEGENTITVTVTAEDGMTMTYTIVVTVSDPPTAEERLLAEYDANEDGEIDDMELNRAIDDYLEEALSDADLNILIDLYLG